MRTTKLFVNDDVNSAVPPSALDVLIASTNIYFWECETCIVIDDDDDYDDDDDDDDDVID